MTLLRYVADKSQRDSETKTIWWSFAAECKWNVPLRQPIITYDTPYNSTAVKIPFSPLGAGPIQ